MLHKHNKLDNILTEHHKSQGRVTLLFPQNQQVLHHTRSHALGKQDIDMKWSKANHGFKITS